MYKNAPSHFNKNGFYLARGLFNEKKILTLEQEFDKIVNQIKISDENINARWGSTLTKKIENINSLVLHTHNVQSYSYKMLKMIQNKKLLDITESIIGYDIILHHSKLFLKPPLIGSAFPLHQDWSYFPTKKNSMIAAVIHLSEANKGMGRIRVVKGSHKLGKINNSDGHSYSKKIHDKHNLDSATAIQAQKGDVLFFHCCTLHGSNSNKSKKPRKTILIQLYSGKDKIEKSSHSNLQLTLRGWNYHATRNRLDKIKS
ncbi:MAG: phytanoyl-CoA dioxygenase family protein [Candidatus Neomarinimicrobiota bacterium]